MTTDKLNRERVVDLHMAMTGYVERGDIPGIVTLIGRGDEIHVDAVGMKTLGGKEAMRRDTAAALFGCANIHTVLQPWPA